MDSKAAELVSRIDLTVLLAYCSWSGRVASLVEGPEGQGEPFHISARRELTGKHRSVTAGATFQFWDRGTRHRRRLTRVAALT